MSCTITEESEPDFFKQVGVLIAFDCPPSGRPAPGTWTARHLEVIRRLKWDRQPDFVELLAYLDRVNQQEGGLVDLCGIPDDAPRSVRRTRDRLFRDAGYPTPKEERRLRRQLREEAKRSSTAE